MDIPKEVTSSTLQLNGVFARLQSGKMTLQEAMEWSLSLTDTIEKKVSQLAQENKKLRIMNRDLHANTYKLKETIAQGEQKISRLEKENEQLRDYKDMYTSLTDDSFLTESEVSEMSQREKQESDAEAELQRDKDM